MRNPPSPCDNLSATLSERSATSAPCAVCGGVAVPLLEQVADPLSGDRFSIERCGRCDLQQTRPQPADLSAYYSPAYYGNRHGWTDRLCVRRRLRMIRQSWPPGSSFRLLDFGCGSGAFLQAAQALGWQVWGVERAAVEPGLAAAVVPQISALPPSAELDGATFWHTLEHVSAPAETLAEVVSRLSPGGLVWIAVPDAGSLQARWFGRHWLHRDVPRHLFHFTRPALRVLLDQLGLRTVREWNGEWEYDLLGWIQSTLNAIGLPVNGLHLALTRPPAGQRWWNRLGWMAVGAAVALLVAPLMAWERWRWGGGSIVLVARKD